MGKEYPEVSVQNQHVDALSARFVLNPQQLDVIVASNLFGDILTDIGGALMGSLGLPASGNIDPSGRHPQPVRARPRLGARASPARRSPTRWPRSSPPR